LWDAIVQFLKLLASYVKWRRGNRASKVFASASAVYDELHRTLHDAGASRAIILRTENSGGVLRIDAPLYSSILYEAVGVHAAPRRHDWQRQRIDEAYVSMLHRLTTAADGHTCIKASDLKGMLANVYKTDGVEMFHLFLVSHSPKHLIYASLNFQTPDKLTAKQADVARSAINKIRNLFDGVPELGQMSLGVVDD
jgi:hypothetical protein